MAKGTRKLSEVSFIRVGYNPHFLSLPLTLPFLLQSRWSPSALGLTRHTPATGLLHLLFPCLWNLYTACFCTSFNSLLKCHLVREDFPDPLAQTIELSSISLSYLFVLLYFSPLHVSSSNLLYSLLGFFSCSIPGIQNCSWNVNIC